MAASQVLPIWFSDLAELYKSKTAHAFSISGNVDDYVIAGGQNAGQAGYFLSTIFNGRELVVNYDRSGFSFPVLPTESERKFKEVLGLVAAEADPTDNIAMMLAEEADDSLPTSPAECIPLLDQLLRNELKVVVVIDLAQTILPAKEISAMPAAERDMLVTITKWATSHSIAARGNIVALLHDGDIHPMIAKSWRGLTIPLPSLEERRAFIAGQMEQGLFTSDLTAEQIINLTAGLSLRMVEDIFLMAILSGNLDRQSLIDRKKELVKAEYGDILEIVDPIYGFEGIGGLDWIKDYFQENIVEAMLNGWHDIVPMGVLMPGAPGTGKSAFATACAAEANMLVFKLNIGGQIASMWQGEGERNLRRVFQAADSAGHCIIFIDELDQAVADRGQGVGNNQQESRILQMLLEYMADTTHRGKVVFLAATNRPDLIDSAIIRSGRFDDIIPFPIPDEAGRAAVFSVMADKYELPEIAVEDVPAKAISATYNWTGADIETATMKAKRIMRRGASYEEAILQAVGKVRSRSSRDAQMMQAAAFEYASDIDFFPPSYREQYSREMVVETPEVAEQAILDNTQLRSAGASREI